MKTKLIAIAITLLAALGVANQANADLVANGGFESTIGSFGPGQKSQFSGLGVTSWSGGTNLTFLDAPGTADNPSLYLTVYGPFPVTSPDGGNFVEADGDPNYSGVIYQTISGLTPGQLYAVSFYQAAGQQLGFTGSTTERWDVGFGSTLGSSTHQLSSLFTLPQAGVGPWEHQTLVFTATGTSDVLSFLATGTPGGAPPMSFLDGVSVEAAPLPSAFVSTAALFIGLMGYQMVRRIKPVRTLKAAI